MKIAVIGGREFTDEKLMNRILTDFVKPEDEIISGGAKGADSMAEKWSKEHNIKFQAFKPEANQEYYFAKRNSEVADACDILIAFPDKNSHGTYHTVGLAIGYKKRVIVIKDADAELENRLKEIFTIANALESFKLKCYSKLQTGFKDIHEYQDFIMGNAPCNYNLNTINLKYQKIKEGSK